MDGIGKPCCGAGASALDQQTLGARVVTETIQKLNTNADGTVNPDHDFQTKVLAGAGIGKHINTTA